VSPEGQGLEIAARPTAPARPRLLGWLAPSTDTRALAAVVLLVAALGATALVVVYARGLARSGPIRGDAIGYYIYLPGVFLDHDLTLARTIQRSFNGNARAAGDQHRERNGYLGPHQTGEAIMLLPFFAVGQGIAVASGARRDGFSWPYGATAAAGGLVYGLIGLAVLGSLLLRLFDRQTAVVTVLAITFGTNLFHYATYEAVYSHIFSFALAAVALRTTFALSEQPRLVPAVLLGASLGLATAVRPTNLILVVFPLLIGVSDLAGVKERVRGLFAGRRLLVAGLVGFSLPLVPQLLYWHTITGRFVINPYVRSDKLELLHPHLLDVAFSVRKGLFFWTPLLVLAVVGVVFLRVVAPALFLPTIVFLVLDFWVVSSWTVWWYGGSFGQRAFVEALPVYALGLAALLAWVRARAARWFVRGAVAVTSLLAAHAMVEYWLGNIPYDQTTWPLYLHSFGKI
jgi:hypothetical protein